jgi:DNA damage-inducible protein 1
VGVGDKPLTGSAGPHTTPMRVTLALDERLVPLEVDPSMTADLLRSVASMELMLPASEFHLWFHGEPLRDDTTLSAAGVADDDIIMVRKIDMEPPAPAASSSSSSSGAQGSEDFRGLTWEDIDTAQISPERLFAILKQNPRMVEQIRHNPELYEAATASDVGKLRLFLMQRELERQSADIEMQALRDRLARDASDAGAKHRLEELERQRAVMANWADAMEHTPEAFGRVTMLYIPCEVNGVSMKAFVDSGAQMTIMSKRMAEATGLMRLCDTRFAGMASGMGSAPILGRVHLAQLKVGKSFFPVSLSIVEQNNLGMLLGLDMLKRHRVSLSHRGRAGGFIDALQCQIDLKDNCLVIEGASGAERVTFLPEHMIGDETETSVAESERAAPTESAAPPSTTISERAAPRSPAVQPPVLPASPGAHPPPSSSSSGATAPSGDREGMITQVMSLGFSREQAEQALGACGWNVQAASSLLFDSMFG